MFWCSIGYRCECCIGPTRIRCAYTSIQVSQLQIKVLGLHEIHKFIYSSLFCRSSCWEEKKQEMKVHAVKKCMLKQIYGVTRKDRTRNEHIREREKGGKRTLKVASIDEKIEDCWIRFGHIHKSLEKKPQYDESKSYKFRELGQGRENGRRWNN